MRQTRSRTILGVSAALAIVFLTGGFAGYKAKTLIQAWRVQRYLASERAEFVNKAVPDVATRTLGGTPWRLADHRGKVVLVEFWQDHCGPCIGEIPFLQEVFRKYGDRDDFIMVGASLDASSETAAVSTKRYHRPWLQLHEKDAGWDNALASQSVEARTGSVCGQSSRWKSLPFSQQR